MYILTLSLSFSNRLSFLFKKEIKFLELRTLEGTHWDNQVVCCFLSIAIPVHSVVARAMCSCVHTYVWCLVVQQFDQSTDAKDDAKVWRAKWPLHSQTHTATANLETSWKIISSCYDQQTCWKLEERRGEEGLTDLSWHWVWNITRPRTSH